MKLHTPGAKDASLDERNPRSVIIRVKVSRAAAAATTAAAAAAVVVVVAAAVAAATVLSRRTVPRRISRPFP